MRGVFVTGTDTGIGKTLVSAWLAHHWQAEYWKPIQTGALEDSDSLTVAALAPNAIIYPPAHVYQAPASPHAAAGLEKAHIALDSLHPPPTLGPLVVEGAGGVMVPLDENTLMIDFIAMLGLPAVVVARSGLGTLNHSLLTLEALRRRHIPILGVVMNGPAHAANRHAIEHFGAVSVLAEIPPLAEINAATVAGLPAPAFCCPEQGPTPP